MILNQVTDGAVPGGGRGGAWGTIMFGGVRGATGLILTIFKAGKQKGHQLGRLIE